MLSPYDAVRATWKPVVKGDFEKAWRAALHAGWVDGTAYDKTGKTGAPASIKAAVPAPTAKDSPTIRPFSASLHRRRRPTPQRISTRPRGAEPSTIWSTICANPSHQEGSHLPSYAARIKMGAKHRLPCNAPWCPICHDPAAPG